MRKQAKRKTQNAKPKQETNFGFGFFLSAFQFLEFFIISSFARSSSPCACFFFVVLLNEIEAILPTSSLEWDDVLARYAEASGVRL